MKKCKNCGKELKKSEYCVYYHGKNVCNKCYSRLKWKNNPKRAENRVTYIKWIKEMRNIKK